MSAPPVGAYGLQVVGIDGADAWLGPVPERFPALRVESGLGRRPASGGDERLVTDNRVVFELGPDRGLVVERGGGTAASATCWDARPPTAAEAVHPLLTAAAAVVGAWSGYDAFHAAAVVGAGGAWGLLGVKGSGKSTLAAAMAANGHAVVCDDMLALRGGTAFAGPRCVDLRTDAAVRLGMGHDLRTDGPRPRWRVGLAPLDAELPLAGWVLLTWGERLDLVRVAPRDVLACLGSHQTWPHPPIDPSTLLDLAARPAWELRRPRDWSSLADVVGALETVLATRRTVAR